jgi:hypothetical protein
MQKRNKKNQSAAADKIKELAATVFFFMVNAGSDSLDFFNGLYLKFLAPFIQGHYISIHSLTLSNQFS